MDRWKTVDRVLSEKGGDFFKGKLFFKVENSEFIKWFEEEKFGITDTCGLTHYAFITRNDIIDVLAVCEPEIKVKQLKNTDPSEI